MTIINSVIIGGGSGDEVEAYALGDAKNAVKDDKVSLNFSADIPLGLEDFLLPANANNSEYLGPRCAAYVDSEYIYYSAPSSQDYIYAYNKKTGAMTTLLSYSSTTQGFISQFGLTSSGTSSSDFKQFIAGKMYNLKLACCGYYANTSDGKIALMCAYQSYSRATGYRILMRDVEGFYSEIVYFNPDDLGFPVCLLDSKDKVNYSLICRKSSTNEIITYNINTATKTLDFVGSITKSAFTGNYHNGSDAISASLGDITFRFSRSDNFALFDVFRTVKDENGVYDVEFLYDLRQQVIDYLTLLGLSDSYSCCGFVGNILCLQNSGRQTSGGDAFIKVNPDTLTVTGYDFAPEADRVYTGLYGNGYSIAYKGIEGSNQKYTVGFMQPIEQPYVATSPQTERFFANQTLTGFVKENKNGVLKVSTVEDPNNPPPAVPDEAGLKIVINYGNADGVFGSVQVGYGYFRNTLTKPSDKYISYDGGMLTEDNIQGSKATTMNIILGRSVDMGSWASDTEGYLSAQDSVVLGVNKKLSTPVYLWHDLSYITPAVPETLEPDVTTTGGSDYVVVGSPVISSGIASGFSADNYITASSAVGSTNNATYKVRFRVDAIGLKGPIMHYEMLFGLNIDESGNLYDWNWSNSAAVNICATTTGHTYTASVNINGTTRSWTVTDETTGQTFTNSLTDSKTTASGDVVLTYGRSSSPTATTYFNGSIYLGGCSASIGDTVVWSTITAGIISLPASWKNIDGVLYEYPDGLPKMQASDLSVNTVEGSNNLYVTKTGDTCGLVISSTSPAGVDSFAVIGTVELDVNGGVSSYSPSGKVIFNGIDVTEHVTEVEVYVGPTRYTISEIPYSVLSEKGILGESGFYTVTKVKPKTGYFFAGDTSYSATSVSLNYVPGFKVLQFGTFKDGQYSTFTGELTFKKVEGFMPAA